MEDVRLLIEKETGAVRTVTPVNEGFNSDFAAIVNTESASYFVKGRRRDHPQAWTQERERAINPAVRHISPCLLWSARNEEWDILGFEYIPGRHVDYSPGSPDLAMVMRTMLQLQQTPAPDFEIKRAEDRWSAYTDKPELFAGTHLLHTDWSPGNVLINGRAYLVDWAWPTRGAGWIDPACWAVWLIASGHRPRSAEIWASRIPSWNQAKPAALNEFARVQVAMWDGIAAESPAAWIKQLAHAARLWTKLRGA